MTLRRSSPPPRLPSVTAQGEPWRRGRGVEPGLWHDRTLLRCSLRQPDSRDGALFKTNEYAQADSQGASPPALSGIGHTSLVDPFIGLQAHLRADE